MRQADVFLESEGDNWFERNIGRIGERDPVSEVIEAAGIAPTSVLEIGCSNGWRLVKLREKFKCDIMGVEPGRQACIEAAKNRVPAINCTASTLPVNPHSFDMVIYAFCLYLTDPADWFTIVSEGDRSLRSGGHVVIHDFANHGEAFARNYEHRDGVRAYHVDFAKFWLAHPLYELVLSGQNLHNEEVSILRKRPTMAIEVRR